MNETQFQPNNESTVLSSSQCTNQSIVQELQMIEAKKLKRLVLSQLVCVEAEILECKKEIPFNFETRLTLESGADALEIKGMQREINRMCHRLESINREQQTMIPAMEHANYKRDDIAVKYGYEKKAESQSTRQKTKVPSPILNKSLHHIDVIIVMDEQFLIIKIISYQYLIEQLYADRLMLYKLEIQKVFQDAHETLSL